MMDIQGCKFIPIFGGPTLLAVRLGKLLCLCLFLLFAAPSHAVPEDSLILSLYANDFEGAEARLDGLTAQFEKRKLSEFEYTAAYRELDHHRPELLRYLNAWVQRRPNSAQALLSRGRFYVRLAVEKRGSKLIDEVPKADLKEMQRVHGLAHSDLTAVLRLKPDSYYAVVQLLNITQPYGAKAEARRLIDQANRLYPQNFVARARYLLQLKPRWGGSYLEMERFIAESKGTGASPQQVRWLTAILKDDQASWATTDPDAKHRLFLDALSLFTDAPRDVAKKYLMFAPSKICWQREHKAARYCMGLY